eukprot:757285-Hanusia_phi.AAC.2
MQMRPTVGEWTKMKSAVMIGVGDRCRQIYIAWIGTDGYGQPCQSSNEMFSKFTQMGVSNIAAQMYTGASSLATKVDRRVTG